MATNHEGGINSGIPDHTGLDELGRAEHERRLEDRRVVVTGNYADLQRQGADAALDENNTAVQIIGTPIEEATTPAQADADANTFTRETERTGDVEEPVAPEPAEETDGGLAKAVEAQKSEERFEGVDVDAAQTSTENKSE